jgi:hypothetical protein
MTCSICGAENCLNPSFCRSCREADARHEEREKLSGINGGRTRARTWDPLIKSP